MKGKIDISQLKVPPEKWIKIEIDIKLKYANV